MLNTRQNTVRDFADMLEDYMDIKADPHAALEVLAEICYGKAEHLRGNWQDEARAKLWERWGNAVDRAGSRLGNPYR